MGSMAGSIPRWVSPITSAIGSGVRAGAQVRAGDEAQAGAEYQARQAEQAAGQTVAAAQRRSVDVQRQATLTESRAQALAAAGGGTATDPTVLNIISKIAGEGQYRSALATYRGAEEARTLNMRAGALRYEGAAAARAGRIGAFGTILSGTSSFFDKYGGGGFKGNNAATPTGDFAYTGYDSGGGPAYG